MDEFEIKDEINDLSEIEKEEKTVEADKSSVEEVFGINEDFYLTDEPENKKSGFPVLGIIAIAVAVVIALGAFFIVRHNRNKENSEAILITYPEEAITAEVRDGELYIDGKKVDPEDVGIDPDDTQQLEEYAAAVNEGDVTVADKVVKKYNISPAGSSSSSGNSSNNSSSDSKGASNGTTKDGTVVKPKGVVITPLTAKEYEIGYSGKISYGLLPLGQVSSSQRGVTITSSDPSVVEVDHLGRFVTKNIGTATITVQSKAVPSAKSSITIKVVDHTTTQKIKVPTIASTTKAPVSTTAPTSKPTTEAPKPSVPQASSGPVYIESMSFKGTSGIDGSYTRSLRVGGSTVIELNFNPSNATKSDVTFSSSNPSVCTVSSDGRVTGVGQGTATVIVSPKNGSAGNLIANITVS